MERLISIKTQYKTLETLEMFMEVSRHRAMEFNKKNVDSISWFQVILSRFSFGRQSGKTTAILDYIKKNEYSNKTIFVVTPNNSYKDSFYKEIYNSAAFIESISSSMNRYRGLCLQYKDVEFIFDECSINDIHAFMYNFLTHVDPKYNITGAVSVGDM